MSEAPQSAAKISPGCEARGHVWGNYNPQWQMRCIVCNAPKPTLPALDEMLPDWKRLEGFEEFWAETIHGTVWNIADERSRMAAKCSARGAWIAAVDHTNDKREAELSAMHGELEKLEKDRRHWQQAEARQYAALAQVTEERDAARELLQGMYHEMGHLTITHAWQEKRREWLERNGLKKLDGRQ